MSFLVVAFDWIAALPQDGESNCFATLRVTSCDAGWLDGSRLDDC